MLFMDIKNLILAVFNQLTRPNAFRNIFVTRNAFGIFSIYSHVSRRTGMPKVAYLSMHDALSAADLMCREYGAHYSVYKCAWCNGWHIGKNTQNRLPNISETATGVLPVVKENVLYEALKQLPISDLAPVYGNGVRGRTLSGRSNVWMLQKIKSLGVDVVIDLRTYDHTDRFDNSVRNAGLGYFHMPVDKNGTDVRDIISALPEFFELLDNGGFYLACAMGLHRTDIAIALYYVFHPSVPFDEVPEMRGHRRNGFFRCDDIATRLNSVMRALTAEDISRLGLPFDYETIFRKRKKHLFDVNRNFDTSGK